MATNSFLAISQYHTTCTSVSITLLLLLNQDGPIAVLLQEVNFLESQVIGGDYLSLETLEADTAKAQRFYERLQEEFEGEVAPQWEMSFQVLIEVTVRLCERTGRHSTAAGVSG